MDFTQAGQPSSREMLTSSGTLVQFKVQMSGSHAPVASQKGQMVPLGSMMGVLDLPKIVPEVPNDTTIWPSLQQNE